jgi:hypothetical protein
MPGVTKALDSRTTQVPAVIDLEDPLAKSDLLSSIGPAFHLAAGPDVIVLRSADGAAGVTVLLQNPFATDLVTTIAVGRKSDIWLRDSITVRLRPLEVGRLVVPLRFAKGTEAKVEIRGFQRGQRIRAKGEGKLDLSRSALGILGGLITGALTPVGHFAITRRGGDVGNPLSLPFETSGGLANGRTSYDRLWSPAAFPPAEVTVVRRREVGKVITTTGYVLACAGGVLMAILAAIIFGGFFNTDGAVVVMAVAVGGLLIAFWHYDVPGAIRPHRSCLTDAVGPGVELTEGKK